MGIHLFGKNSIFKKCQKIFTRKLLHSVVKVEHFSFPSFFRVDFCNFSIKKFILALFKNFEDKRARNGSKKEKKNFFYKSVLELNFCNHQPLGTSKL
jgi:hypothetical protein